MNLLAEKNKQRNDCKAQWYYYGIDGCKFLYCIVVFFMIQTECLEDGVDGVEEVNSQNNKYQ